MVARVQASTPISTEVRFVAVERDVQGLKADIGEIKSMLAAIAGKGTNWTAVGLVVGTVVTISGWGFGLFGNFQSRTNDDIASLKVMISAGIAEQKAAVVAMQADTKASIATLAASTKAADDALANEIKTQGNASISRPDLLDKFQTAKEKRDSQQAATDARIERMEKEFAEAKKDVVPLGTHEQQWSHQNYLNNLFEKGIEEVRKKSDDLFNGRDVIQRLMLRLDRLEGERK